MRPVLIDGKFQHNYNGVLGFVLAGQGAWQIEILNMEKSDGLDLPLVHLNAYTARFRSPIAEIFSGMGEGTWGHQVRSLDSGFYLLDFGN